ncbi:hypothetical protein D3C86_1338480 [compost metagenome]
MNQLRVVVNHFTVPATHPVTRTEYRLVREVAVLRELGQRVEGEVSTKTGVRELTGGGTVITPTIVQRIGK